MDTGRNQMLGKQPLLPLNSKGITNESADMIFQSFFQFIFKNKVNKKYLYLASLGGIIEFILLKILFPFPDFISDSYSYIDTNLYHMEVNLWPIGYSKFLWLIHLITPSPTFLVFSHYFILEMVMLYFFFSIRYLYALSKNHTILLFIFLFFNPLFLYLSNFVLSDALFCSISIVLFTQYLWMLYRPRLHHVIIQALLIGMAFTIRYTAIYYPIVAVVAFILSHYQIRLKLAGILSPWLLIIPFIIYTQQKTKQVTGTAEFSVFGGWQIANNALYMYDHLQIDTTKLPTRTLELDRLARKYFNVVPPENRQLAPLPGTFFIKVPNAILKPYMLSRYSFVDPPGQFQAWGKVSPIYKEYGTYLIKHYPLAFVRFYLWLNTKNYFIPHLEKFSNYNRGQDSVGDAVKIWFQLKNWKVKAASFGRLQSYIFYLYPTLFMMLNLYFIGGFLFIYFKYKFKSIQPVLYFPFILTASFLTINFCFSIFATPVVLRYQIFPFILLICFSLFITEALDQSNVLKK